MNREARLPIWRDCNCLLLEIEMAVRQFPRYHKYAVGADMRKQAMFICRMLVRALPLWQPAEVSGYKSQQRFFRRWVPNAETKMQRGCRFDTSPPAPRRFPGDAWKPSP